MCEGSSVALCRIMSHGLEESGLTLLECDLDL